MNLKTTLKLLAAALAAASLAACSSIHHVHNASAKISCGLEYHKWAKNGGLDKLHTAGTQIATMARQIESHESKSVKKNAKTVSAAITAAQKDLPPNCIPGLDKDVNAALTDAKNAVNDSAKQNQAGLKAAGVELKKAKASLKLTAQDVKDYLKS